MITILLGFFITTTIYLLYLYIKKPKVIQNDLLNDLKDVEKVELARIFGNISDAEQMYQNSIDKIKNIEIASQNEIKQLAGIYKDCIDDLKAIQQQLKSTKINCSTMFDVASDSPTYVETVSDITKQLQSANTVNKQITKKLAIKTVERTDLKHLIFKQPISHCLITCEDAEVFDYKVGVSGFVIELTKDQHIVLRFCNTSVHSIHHVAAVGVYKIQFILNDNTVANTTTEKISIENSGTFTRIYIK